MEFKAERKFVITLDNEEAEALAYDLAKVPRHHGSAGITRQVLAYLSTRNERHPSGVQKVDRDPSDW